MPQTAFLRDGRAPIPVSASTSRVMSANRAKGTSPEVELRRALATRGVRKFRTNPSSVIGRPDVVFDREKLAIFVNGCFWHRCPHCHPSMPKTHRKFWIAKFRANRLRDARKAQALRAAGWGTLTVWECRLNANPSGSVIRVLRALERRKASLHARIARRRFLKATRSPVRLRTSARSEGLPPRITLSATKAAATS
jgi:DNA mismatch endonuclease, patch repair protein